ncbi:MAG TPA: tetratricopeptide repeat protein [Acidobacteriota bacterium]|nr:tetratricopeptide repeat protein [Acidobacteriota bacterium]
MHIQARKFFLPLVLTVGWLLVMAVAGSAQTRSVKGKVIDDKGQPVESAQITIMGTDITRSFTCKTNKKGEYLYLLGQQVGTYRIVVRKEGFKPDVKENVRPELGEAAVVDFTISPGADYKLPFEMDQKDLADYKKKYEEQQKKKQFSGEVQAAFKQGVQLTNEGKYDEALAEFNKALEKEPEQPAIHAAIGNAYAKAGKNDQALASYQKAISLSPNDPDLYTTAGITMNAMGKTAEAQDAFKKAAALNPQAAAQNYYNLGVIFMNSGKTDEAADAFKQSVAADPNFAESYYQLGMALSGKQISAAIDALKKYIAIGKKPDQVEVAKQIIQALSTK